MVVFILGANSSETEGLTVCTQCTSMHTQCVCTQCSVCTLYAHSVLPYTHSVLPYTCKNIPLHYTYTTHALKLQVLKKRYSGVVLILRCSSEFEVWADLYTSDASNHNSFDEVLLYAVLIIRRRLVQSFRLKNWLKWFESGKAWKLN